MHNVHLAAGDVHLWWLFPEDVGLSTLQPSSLSVSYGVMGCKHEAQASSARLTFAGSALWQASSAAILKPSGNFEDEHAKQGCTQVMDEGLLRTYESLLTDEEHAHMLEGSTPAIRKERLLARVLVRTTLSRYYTSLQLFPLSKL